MRFVILARVLPLAARSASCVGRTLTMANSAATKNPFATTKRNARTKYQPGMLTGYRRGGQATEVRCPCGSSFYSGVGRRRGYDLVEGLPEPRIRLRNDLFLRDGDASPRQAADG